VFDTNISASTYLASGLNYFVVLLQPPSLTAWQSFFLLFIYACVVWY